MTKKSLLKRLDKALLSSGLYVLSLSTMQIIYWLRQEALGHKVLRPMPGSDLGILTTEGLERSQSRVPEVTSEGNARQRMKWASVLCQLDCSAHLGLALGTIHERGRTWISVAAWNGFLSSCLCIASKGKRILS